MGKAIEKSSVNQLVKDAAQFGSPEEILELNGQVIDATNHAQEMIEEIDQLGFSLDRFIEKQKLYNKCRGIIRRKLQDAMSEL